VYPPNSRRAIRSFILTVVLAGIAHPAHALVPAHFWASARRRAGADRAGVAVDASGNVVMIANISGTVDFGGGALVASGSTVSFS
jgi:hypothetical protein